jgi:hypothetical protein
MKFSVALVSEDLLTGRKTIARSTDPHLVRHVIISLRDNRLLEDDEADVIYDPAFPSEAGPMIACLTAQIRQSAAESHSEADAHSEGGGDCTPAINAEDFNAGDWLLCS